MYGGSDHEPGTDPTDDALENSDAAWEEFELELLGQPVWIAVLPDQPVVMLIACVARDVGSRHAAVVVVEPGQPVAQVGNA